MKRHLLAMLGCCVFVAVALAPTAGADPIHAKNSLTLTATCPSGTGSVTYQAVVNGNGTFTPAHLIGSTKVFVPTAFNLTTTFTPKGGTMTTDHNTAAKSARVKNTITCTIPFQSFPSPQGTFTIQGTVTGFLTPR